MWYAQQDPLIVYKKESFEKFQTLIYTYKVNTTSYILNLDFDAIKQQDEAVKLIIEKQKAGDKEFLQKLSKVSGNLWEMIKVVQAEQAKQQKAQPVDKREMIFEDEDGFEIFEVDWDKKDVPEKEDYSEPLPTNAKIRPNDKVTVKYEDGRMEYEVKYKKVKDEVENKKCTVVRIHND